MILVFIVEKNSFTRFFLLIYTCFYEFGLERNGEYKLTANYI
jgi:hypothetical protein